jgi:peptide/nickel transport system substrate-binding protein
MKKYVPIGLWYLLALLLIVVLAACGAEAQPEPATEEPAAPAETPTEPVADTPDAAPPPAEEEVVMRIGALQDTDCWNPFSCFGVWFWTNLVIEGFTDHGPASTGCEGVPRLAESWEYSDEGRTWTIHLHDGITFSDGKPVKAQTVVDFINWFRNSETLAEWYAESYLMESVEVVDDLTLRYTTSDPLLNSPDYDWQWWFLLDTDYWSGLTEDEILTVDFNPPIGTGPYTLAEHMPGSHMIFEARDDYYQGKPPIDRVVFQVFSNPDALVNALLAGEIDLTTPWLPPESYEALLGRPGIEIEEKPPGEFTSLVFNVSSMGNKHPAIDDPLVREAIDYAVDKEQIVEVALLGHGVTCPTNWHCGPNYVGELNPDLVVTPYDPDKANQLLEEAGYVDTDGDGIRETPDGEPLIFRLFFQTHVPTQVTMVDLLSDWLGNVGIGIETEAQELGTYISVVLDERDFDIALDTEVRDIDPASMDFWFSCWSAESGSAALNYPGYCNEEMDNLVYEFWNSTDMEGRWEPMFEAQALLNADRPIITLAGHNSFQAYRTDRFEFPLDTCDVDFGMFSSQGLLNTKVK